MLVVVKSQVSEGFISERMNLGNSVAFKAIFASFADDKFPIFFYDAGTFQRRRF